MRMRRGLLLVALLLVVVAAGCGGGMARVRGKVVENGQPVTFPAFQASVQMSPFAADGKPDTSKVYSAVLNTDGTFELVASGGELPTGDYLLSIAVATGGGKPPEAGGKGKGKGKGAEKPKTYPTMRRTLRSGTNDLTLDLAKPEG